MTQNSHLEPAQSGLRKIAHSLLASAPPGEAPLIAWPLACGPQVAEKTRALAFTDGVLAIEVPDAAWREQLRDLAASYVRALASLVGNRVQRIEFILAAGERK